MKTTPSLPVSTAVRAWGRRVALVACLLSAAPTALVAQDIIIDTFDTDSSGQFSRWWGLSATNFHFAWDAGKDASNNAASGALKVTIDFDYGTYGGENQFAFYKPFAQVNGALYTNLSFDIFWDPASPVRTGGDHGWLEPGFRNADWSQNWLAGLTVPANSGWMHVVLPINPNAAKIDTINGVLLKMWNGNQSAYTGPATFWLDNIKLIARTNTTVAPPVLSIEKAVPGLRAFASAAGAQYQRQGLRTRNPVYSWVGATDPVTYSMTINDYPGGGYSGFQAHLFIVPGTSLATWLTGPDWSEPNVVFLHLQNNADGSAYCAFRYKTNQPNGNTMLFGSGAIASIGAPSPKGTWNLTFDPGGNISLSAPNGAVTNFSLPPDAVTRFSGSTYAYFGIQPNQLTSIGQSATFGRLQITGVASPINDNFSAASLDTATWEVMADDVPGIVVVPSDATMWLNWTLPGTGFRFQYVPGVDYALADVWYDATINGTQIGDLKRAIIRSTDLPAFPSGNYFFRMINP